MQPGINCKCNNAAYLLINDIIRIAFIEFEDFYYVKGGELEIHIKIRNRFELEFLQQLFQQLRSENINNF